MNAVKDKKKYFSVRIPLTEKEEKEFRKFLKNTGRSAGPFLRVLILSALEVEKTDVND